MKSIMRKCCRSFGNTRITACLGIWKGLEVNTSSYRYGLSDTTPSVEILKRYRELGGKIVTIGSDSHKPEHLGAYIEETKEMLRKAGYTQFCTYERMSPVFHDL